jgi:hypothetical protein
MEFYSAIKKNEIIFLAGKWMELNNIMLNEVSQAQKIEGHMFSLIFGSYTYKLSVYIETYMIIYMYMKENKNVLVSLFEGATGGGREKENVRE